MKQKLAIKWAEALESGDYKQGRGTLRDIENRFCCLGVLCDILGRKWKQCDASCYAVRGTEGAYDCDTMPPPAVYKRVGLEPYIADTFAKMNDGYEGPKKSFKQIAKQIRRMYAA